MQAFYLFCGIWDTIMASIAIAVSLALHLDAVDSKKLGYDFKETMKMSRFLFFVAVGLIGVLFLVLSQLK